MSADVLILRPQPGAEETAARARAIGLEPAVAPLFTVRALAWSAPDAVGFDAVILTSAHAARLAGDGLTPFAGLPCYAVGGRTAEAAGAAGFGDVRTGPSDGAALLKMMAADEVRRAFHPCGRDHLDLVHPSVRIVSVPVYAADAAEHLPPEAEDALSLGAVALLHSPRAARLFASLAAPAETTIAAISPAVAEAAGAGWAAVAVAPVPRDEALLELAAKLCQTKRD